MATDVSTKQEEEQATESTRPGQYYRPNVDIIETPEELLILADMPGVKSDAVDIDFEDGLLTVHGRTQPRHANTQSLLCEYGVGDFYRTFRVGEQVDSNRITAELSDGVLRLHLPKAEAAKPKKIQVRAAG